MYFLPPNSSFQFFLFSLSKLKKYVSISSTDKAFYGGIRDLAFEPYLYQKPNEIVVWW